MDNLTKDLHELCETLARSVSVANEKIRGAGGKLTAADSEYIDRLTHSLKSIKSVEKMLEEAEMEDDGYSERMYSRGYDRSSYRGSYNDGGSYGRGRMNARRDAMGRYSRDDGYSRGGSMADELRDLAENAPNDQIKQELMRIVGKM